MRFLPPLRPLAAALVISAFIHPAHAGGDDDKFRRLVKDATEAYGAGELEKSISLLKEAYALREDPRLLYNIAKATEGLGKWQEAVDGYRLYLEKEPMAANRDLVLGRIKVLEQQLEEREQQDTVAERIAGERAEAAGDRAGAIAHYERYLKKSVGAKDREEIRRRIEELKKPPKREPPSAKAKTEPRKSPLAAWIVTGVGVAAAATGGVFAVLSRGKYDDANGATSGQNASDLAATADSYTTIANIGLIGGAVITAGGLTWVLLGSGGDKEKSSVSLSVQPNGISVGGRL
ncbi:MAG: hypothetical protein R3B13_30050 [Polyangiaceae bacterium]